MPPENVDQNVTPETNAAPVQQPAKSNTPSTTYQLVMNEDGSFDVPSLPEPVQGYIRGLRQEAASRRVAGNELQQQIEQLQSQITQRENQELEATGQWRQLVENQQTKMQQMQQQLEAERLNNQRTVIGLQFGLAPQWLDRLQGNTPDELAADAQRLADMLGNSQQAPVQQKVTPPATPEVPPAASTAPVIASQLNQPSAPPPTGIPPAAPSGETPPNNDAYRRSVYFGQGGNTSPLFSPDAGGVQFYGTGSNDKPST